VSYVPQEWRPLTRFGWGGKAATNFRGGVQLDRDEIRSWNASQTWGPNYRGHVGTVEFRYVGAQNTTYVTGVTRDNTGAALGGCTVSLFITGADVEINKIISDASGNYSFVQPGSGPFYVVAYKAGSPDVAGTTVNTLIAV